MCVCADLVFGDPRVGVGRGEQGGFELRLQSNHGPHAALDGRPLLDAEPREHKRCNHNNLREEESEAEHNLKLGATGRPMRSVRVVRVGCKCEGSAAARGLDKNVIKTRASSELFTA